MRKKNQLELLEAYRSTLFDIAIDVECLNIYSHLAFESITDEVRTACNQVVCLQDRIRTLIFHMLSEDDHISPSVLKALGIKRLLPGSFQTFEDLPDKGNEDGQ